MLTCRHLQCLSRPSSLGPYAPYVIALPLCSGAEIPTWILVPFVSGGWLKELPAEGFQFHVCLDFRRVSLWIWMWISTIQASMELKSFGRELFQPILRDEKESSRQACRFSRTDFLGKTANGSHRILCKCKLVAKKPDHSH